METGFCCSDSFGNCPITSITITNFYGSGPFPVIQDFNPPLDPNDAAAIEAVKVVYPGPFDNQPLFEYEICSGDICATATVGYCK